MTALFPTWREWLFSAKSFVAAMLALYIALAAGLPRPYWAMAAVYVVANPLSGATRSKALYRALGTFIGAAGAVLLVPLLVNAPELLSLAVALWTGLFLFVSMLDRTPRSYVFMLAGYSLPLIALPTVGSPETVFDVAVARSLEITLGIACASLVHSLVFPTAVGPTLGAQVARWKNDAAAWIADILKREDAGAVGRERLRLAADIRSLDMLISQLAYDTAASDAVRGARELRARLGMVLPILSSLGDRAGAMRAAGAEPEAYPAVKAALLTWIADPAGTEAEAEALRRRIAAMEPGGAAATGWPGLILSSTLARMRDLLDLWQDIRVLEARISAGKHARGRLRGLRLRDVFRPVHHYDFGLMAFSAGSVVLATLAASLLWIGTGWVEGSGCVIMTAVGASFFATSDDPAPQIRSFTVWMTIAAAISGVYLFAILPVVHGFEMLVAAFLVPFLVVGTLVGRPQFMLVALLLAVNIASLVGIQESYSADFGSFVNGNLASIAGGFFGLAWTMATRPFGAALAAKRLVRAGWRDLAAIAGGGTSRRADERFAGRMLDRAGQLAPRLALTADPDTMSSDSLGELRLGLNLVQLKRVAPRLPREVAAAVDSLLGGIATLFARRAETGRALPPDAAIRAAIDRLLDRLAAAPADAARQDALHALVGLRRALFPAAPAPALRERQEDEPQAPFAVAAE
ncbi:membrane protein [Aureimonas endophytica]|uniref:Membrane protein n=1 Tax=Aureimonas endophytica TaxID=2027858 RepID=A0A917E6U0_9HYPH|nr:FUSC family protein [Aureimonas endophytica]GGE09001.1 membrane protein [Aureimonas endophytica]